MTDLQERSRKRTFRRLVCVAAGALLVVAEVRCGRPGPAKASGTVSVLRIGLGHVGSESAGSGLRQIEKNLSTEALVRLGQDGRPQPGMASDWVVSPDG